jgi:hypothetical protein
MPWKASDAAKHDLAAKSPKRKRQWAATANAILKRTGDDVRAIRGANSVVKKSQSRRTRRRS